MKRYEAYKECNIPWIKQIPSHWMTTRAKFLYKKEQRPVREEDSVVTCFRDGMVTLRKNRRTTGFTEAISEFGYQGIRKGDLVIHVMDAFAGAIGVSDSDGKGTPVYNVCTACGDSNNYYYAYALREMARTGFIQSLYRGIRERSSDFRFDVFARQYLPVPPREEQDQIVRYLDWQVSKINRLISAKRKEVELYKEQMCKVFSVSSSENQKVRLKRVCDLVFQPVDIRPDAMYCKTGMYNRGRGIFRREPMLGCELGDSMFQHIDRNHVMISGQFAWEGAAYVTSEADEEGIVSHRYYLLKPTRVTAEYIWAYLMSDKGLLEMLICSHGSAGRNRPLNIEELLNTYIPLPNSEADEKRVISAVRALMYIYRQKERVFQLYEQLRTRLISDVVTGQVDVRGIEVPEFEYVGEADVAGEQDEEETEEEVDG